MKVEEAKKLFDSQDAVFVDVREGDERSDFGEIPGSTHIPLHLLPINYAAIEKDKTVVVYCATGARSHYASEFLKKHGYQDTHNLEGGLSMWSDKQYPIQK